MECTNVRGMKEPSICWRYVAKLKGLWSLCESCWNCLMDFGHQDSRSLALGSLGGSQVIGLKNGSEHLATEAGHWALAIHVRRAVERTNFFGVRCRIRNRAG